MQFNVALYGISIYTQRVFTKVHYPPWYLLSLVVDLKVCMGSKYWFTVTVFGTTLWDYILV